MRHRAIALSLAGLLAAPAARAQQQVVIVTSFPKEITETYKKAFEAKNPGIRVEIVNKPTPAGVAYIREAPANNKPDVFWVSAPVAIIFGAFASYGQSDFKRLVAYSSVNHMGFVVLGIAAAGLAAGTADARIALNGAVLQMFNHGLSAAGMFFLVGVIYDRTHTRNLDDFGGLFPLVPVYGGVLIFASMASLGLPGLNGFISEFLVVRGTYPILTGFTAISMIGVLFTGAYILKGIMKVLHGPLNDRWSHGEHRLTDDQGIFMKTWHTLPLGEIFQALSSSEAGLTTTEAKARIQTHGPNELQERKGKSALVMLGEQFSETMVLILIAAALISAFLGKGTETAAILAIVVLFAVLGFVQEYRAERAMAALKQLAVPVVRVRRDGTVHEMSARDHVPGDVVLLEAGNALPADVRLVESAGLRVQEAALTGESEAVEKHIDPIPEPDLPCGQTGTPRR